MIVLLATLGWGQSAEFTPLLQVRPRVEAHTGRDGTASDGDDVFVNQRARLGVLAELDDVSVLVLVQDVRVWGEEVHTLFDATANRFDLHEGWLNVAMGETASVRIGRQEINLHEQRLIGAVGWTPQARAFDGVRLSGGKTGVNGEVTLAILGDETEAVPPAPLAAVPRPWWQLVIARGGWAGEEGDAVADVVYILSAINSDDGDPTNDGMIHTTGAYAKGATGPASGRVEGYAQLGELGSATRGAWMLGVSGTLAPESDLKPGITVFYDHLSGDDDPGDQQDKAFDTLFDTRHKFYGLIDVMNFGVGGRADGRGLQDAGVKVQMSPTKGLKTGIDGHLFLAGDPQGGDALLGQEVDWTLGYKWKEGLKVGVGAAVLARPDVDPDAWGFLQLDAQL